MKIVRVINDSFQEYDEHHSLVLFSKGCNLSCRECYNLESLDKLESIGEAIDVIEKNLTPLHDAVVFLGGEPTIHNDLIHACRYAKRKSVLVKVFTNGMISPASLCEEHVVDMFSVDLKCVRDCSYIIDSRILDEVYLQTLHDNIVTMIRYQIPVELRTTRWKCVLGQLEDIKAYAKKEFPGLPHIIQNKFTHLT